MVTMNINKVKCAQIVKKLLRRLNKLIIYRNQSKQKIKRNLAQHAQLKTPKTNLKLQLINKLKITSYEQTKLHHKLTLKCKSDKAFVLIEKLLTSVKWFSFKRT